MTVDATRALRAREWTWAAAVGVVAIVVNSWQVGVPSLLGDEAVTISIATRTLEQIWVMVTQHSDAVHGVYYLGAHAWFAAFGADATTVRMLSVIAVGVAVTGAVAIGARFVSLTAGVTAGILLTVLPASLMAATVGRSYPLQIAATTWLAFALLVALERGGAGRWVVVAALTAVSASLYLFTALVVVGFGVAVLLHRPWRERVLPMAASAISGLLVALPIALLGYQQRYQVAWIEPIGPTIFESLLVSQWFSGVIHVGTSYPAWLPYVTAAVYLSLALAGFIVAWRRGGVHRGLVLLCAMWVTLPSAVLVGVSLVVQPFYSPLYTTMSAPGVALLAAMGVTALGRRWMRAAIVAVLVLAAVPPYLALRVETSHLTDWHDVARTLDREAEAGDAVLVEAAPWDLPHMLFRLYPAETADLRDIAFLRSAGEAATVWDVLASPDDLGVEDDVRRVWVVSDADGGTEWDQWLDAAGFTDREAFELTFSTVTLFTR